MDNATLQGMRLRITFAKTAAMRYTGHLDLHRTWERTFRRAGLPLAYSRGYNPHPKLNLASALPLGFTSQEEVLDVWLEVSLDLKEIAQALTRALPPGLKLNHIIAVDPQVPSLQTELEESEYVITFREHVSELKPRIDRLLAMDTLPRVRGKKNYDLRPLIHHLEILEPGEDCEPRILARLAAQEGATGRPEEVVDALGVNSDAISVQRTRLIFKKM